MNVERGLLQDALDALRKASVPRERSIGDLDCNAALWLGTRAGLDARVASLALGTDVRIDTDRLMEAPYLAALGFVRATGAMHGEPQMLRETLSRILQRKPHTIERAGYADRPWVLIGLTLLAKSVDDHRAHEVLVAHVIELLRSSRTIASVALAAIHAIGLARVEKTPWFDVAAARAEAALAAHSESGIFERLFPGQTRERADEELVSHARLGKFEPSARMSSLLALTALEVVLFADNGRRNKSEPASRVPVSNIPRQPGESNGTTLLVDANARAEQRNVGSVNCVIPTNPSWFELIVRRDGEAITFDARGSRDESTTEPVSFVAYNAFRDFAASVERAARYCRPLEQTTIRAGRELHAAIVTNRVGRVFHRLLENAGGPLLVRISVHDTELHDVPWEALLLQDDAHGLGMSKIQPVRRVITEEPWRKRSMVRPVRVLAIAPTDTAGLENLRQSLETRISMREIEWLDPIIGEKARSRYFLDQLRRRRAVHIVHFLGHGAIRNDEGPALRMADHDEDEDWLRIGLFAQLLQTGLSEMPKLIVLEACNGAAASVFGSAADALATAGTDAVVAHLWPIRADAARICSTEFYRELTQLDRSGDVAKAMNAARLAMLANREMSAEAYSPVLYLRGTETKIFNFDDRPLGRETL